MPDVSGRPFVETEVLKQRRKAQKHGRPFLFLLRFNDGAFQDPFLARQMSDGTLKVFAYLLLLEDPDPPPFICVEELWFCC